MAEARYEGTELRPLGYLRLRGELQARVVASGPELTDVGLLLDTGHLALGGGDPVQGLRDWSERIDHLHVKDYKRSILESVIADRAGMEGRGAAASSASSAPATSTCRRSSRSSPR